MKLTQQQSTQELCSSMGLNFDYCFEEVQRYNIDAHSFLMRLDECITLIDRMEIVEDFLLAIRPF